MDAILRQIKSLLEQSEALGPFSVEKAQKWAKKVGESIPANLLPSIGSEEASHLELSYAKPSDINVVGSYPLKCGLSPATADMIVEMPLDLLKEKDHLNLRYLYKRNFYLMVIASILSKHLDDSKYALSIEKLHRNVYKTVLVISLKDSGERIQILPSLPENSLKPFRLAPGKGSIRKDYSASIFKTTIDEDAASPHINACILTDMVFNRQSMFLREVFAECPTLPSGLQMIKSWLKQRQNACYDGHLTGFHITMLVAFAHKHAGIFDASMNELQILKVFLKFLSSLDGTRIMSLCNARLHLPPEYGCDFEPKSFADHYELVLIDPSGYLNLLYDVRHDAFSLLKSEAKASYAMIMADPDAVKPLVLLPDNIAIKGDMFFTIELHGDGHDFDDITGQSMTISNISKTLKRALSDRITGLICSRVECGVQVSLFLNKAQCFRLVDLGPNHDEKEAAREFRDFWGAKSELRRFKDSSIKEAVVWEHLAKDRHLIVKDICEYILPLRCALEPTNFVLDQLDFAVPKGSFGPVTDAFEHISKILRGLSGIPLSIVSCEAISASCRYSDISVPRKIHDVVTRINKLPSYYSVHEVVARLEASGKWPEDAHAAKLLKEAFGLRIAKAIQEQHHLECSFAKDFIDVTCDGYIFRIHLTYPGEISLVSRNGLESSSLEELVTHRSRHHKAILGVYISNLVFGPVARLAKRFVASQMLSSVIKDELVELLVASVFTNPRQYSEPVSSWSGFLRFLHLISSFDWEAGCLAVNFEADSDAKKTEIEASMAKYQNDYAVLVTTSYDSNFSKPSCWSIPSSQVVVWKEFCRLASAALKYLLDHPHDDLSVIFKRSTKAFDAVLNLAPQVANRRLEQIGASADDEPSGFFEWSQRACLRIKNCTLHSGDFLRLLPGFDPVALLLADLRRNFGKSAAFYTDPHGGQVIGVKYTVSSLSQIDRDHLLSKFYMLGKDMLVASS